jgi:hypothetical protein
MTAKDLNMKLISVFPELRQAYMEQTEWQEGDNTGSHVVFGDVLVPIMLMYIKSGNYEIVKKYFDFLEGVLRKGDTYAANVIATSVIESIAFDDVAKGEVRKLLGEKCLEIWNEYSL